MRIDKQRIAIELINISKKISASASIEAVSFRAPEGECLAVLGPSGCGKTSLLRIIAGLESLDWGEVWLSGKLFSSPEITIPPYRRSVGMVFQDLALWPHKTVGENIQFGMDRTIRGRKQKKIKTEELLKLVRLDCLKGAYPHQLSGGEKQRLAIARALGQNAKILLLDEPLSNLDISLKKSLLKELRTILNSVQLTCIYVTHDEREARFLSQRIVRLRKGRITSIDHVQSDTSIGNTGDNFGFQVKYENPPAGKIIQFKRG